MPVVCPMYARCMPVVCPLYARCMPDVCPMYARCMPDVCPLYARCMPDVCFFGHFVCAYSILYAHTAYMYAAYSIHPDIHPHTSAYTSIQIIHPSLQSIHPIPAYAIFQEAHGMNICRRRRIVVRNNNLPSIYVGPGMTLPAITSIKQGATATHHIIHTHSEQKQQDHQRR